MVKFSLLENALDSVEIGLKYFSKARTGHDRKDYKQCLLNLFQAAELLLKAVVSRQEGRIIFNPKSLIKHCKNPEHPTESELHRCQSVSIEQLCKLLAEHYPCAFPETAFNIMKSVAQMRNNIQHFAIATEPQYLSLQLQELYQQIFRPAFLIIQ
ncbi:hypothetical protein [Pantoea agglomerans]|uniref:hypothetical protein n=1 Tax=Enterobacter agglomerans TaxID=549 RepID=UPI001F4F837D|nr:hypothetical protein [Pantoea agglomerans]